MKAPLQFGLLLAGASIYLACISAASLLHLLPNLRNLLVHMRRLRVTRRKEWAKVNAAFPNQVWQMDMTKVWAGASVGWAYLVSAIDGCTREIVGWDLSLRCRTDEARSRRWSAPCSSRWP